MGTVWLSRMRKLRFERLVALKTILPIYGERPDLPRRCSSTRRASRRRSSTRTSSRTLDVGEDHGDLYFAMEYIDGRVAPSAHRRHDAPIKVFPRDRARDLWRRLRRAPRGARAATRTGSRSTSSIATSRRRTSSSARGRRQARRLRRREGRPSRVGATRSRPAQGQDRVHGARAGARRRRSIGAPTSSRSARALRAPRRSVVTDTDDGKQLADAARSDDGCPASAAAGVGPAAGIADVVERAMASHPEDRYQTMEDITEQSSRRRSRRSSARRTTTWPSSSRRASATS